MVLLVEILQRLQLDAFASHDAFKDAKGPIHKGCPHIRGEGGQEKLDK